MTEQQRDKLVFTPEQMEDVECNDGWEDIHKEHYDKRRWYDIWKYVVQNKETGKYLAQIYEGENIYKENSFEQDYEFIKKVLKK